MDVLVEDCEFGGRNKGIQEENEECDEGWSWRRENTEREREMMGGEGREKETQETQVRCVTSFGV